MKNEDFRKELIELFTQDELSYFLQEALWIGEDKNGKIDSFFFVRDKGMVEIFLPVHEGSSEDVEIAFVSTLDRRVCSKKEFIEFIYDSKQKELPVISVD